MMQPAVLSLPHIDARTRQPRTDQAALLRFDDAAIMFTASWCGASLPVPRPDGAYRRQYLVHLTVPDEHRQRAFHRVRSATLYVAEDREPIVASDFGGVQSIERVGITLALFADELC
jgi:hypothetical protein